jgi:hypothetical protein
MRRSVLVLMFGVLGVLGASCGWFGAPADSDVCGPPAGLGGVGDALWGAGGAGSDYGAGGDVGDGVGGSSDIGTGVGAGSDVGTGAGAGPGSGTGAGGDPGMRRPPRRRPIHHSVESPVLEPQAGPSTGSEAGVCGPANTYINCMSRGLTPQACAYACEVAGASCGSVAPHPFKLGQGIGTLSWCKNGGPTFTCTYTFPSGEGCAGIWTLFGLVRWLCIQP